MTRGERTLALSKKRANIGKEVFEEKIRGYYGKRDGR